MGERDVDLGAHLGEPAVQQDPDLVALAHDLDVLPRPRGQPERLGHRLLRAEARREVLAGPRAPRRVGALALGEEPRGQRRPALERLLETLDLEEVDPGAGHGRGAYWAVNLHELDQPQPADQEAARHRLAGNGGQGRRRRRPGPRRGSRSQEGREEGGEEGRQDRRQARWQEPRQASGPARRDRYRGLRRGQEAARLEGLGRRVVAVPAERHADAGRAAGARYSTVTVFARLRGWSTLRPRFRAMA